MVLVETTPQEWELRLITSERDEKKKSDKKRETGEVQSRHNITVL